MPDEVADKDSDIVALSRALLDCLQETDGKLGTDAHAAVKDAVHLALLFAKKLADRFAAPATPHVWPGAALGRLLAALDDRDRGIVDPVLQPQNKHGGNYLSLPAKQERFGVVLAMELLMAAGQHRQPAANEVVRLLGNQRAIFEGHDGSPWRLVARWRDELRKDTDFKKMIDESVAEITASLKGCQDIAEALRRIARMALNQYR
jgi:hypothetical protein